MNWLDIKTIKTLRVNIAIMYKAVSIYVAGVVKLNQYIELGQNIMTNSPIVAFSVSSHLIDCIFKYSKFPSSCIIPFPASLLKMEYLLFSGAR